MLVVTIKLFDTMAQKQYQADVELHKERIDELMKTGAPWPSDMRHPVPPEPMTDSKDPVFCTPSNYSVGPSNVPGSSMTDAVELDGTSQSGVLGWDSRWSASAPASSTPFTKLKKG